MPRRSPALVLVHVVWTTSRRRRLLMPAFDATLSAILGDRARAVGCCLLACGCACDHVHSVLRVAPSVGLADLVRRLKGGSAHDSNHRSLMPERLAWQEGYWAESLSPADFDPVASYVRRQREHHDNSHPAERWQFHDEREPDLGSQQGGSF
jgi:putative transposase